MPGIAHADPNRLGGSKVLVFGLGTRQGGVGVARFLVEAGAQVRVTDRRTAIELAEPLLALAHLPLEYTLGGHADADIAWADVIVRNPAVPRDAPLLALARRQGKRVEMEMTLFLRACPARVAAVTGTKGKTTTTTLLHAMLRERDPAAVLVGNMGRSALGELSSLNASSLVALELSSFQAEGLSEHALAPHVVVITNIAEDHLDRYATFAEYADVKLSVATHQRESDWLLVPIDDALIEQRTRDYSGRRVTFGRGEHAGERTLWIEQGRFTARWDGQMLDLGLVSALRMPGEHSQLNALAAAGAALAVGVLPEHVRRGLAGFNGVRDRLEHVATIGGVEYINDTAATAPSAALAALSAYAGRDLLVIAGGSDKRLALDDFAEALAATARLVLLLQGSATPALEALLRGAGYDAIAGPFGSMSEAVSAAAREARPGTVVLLSPGCASFGLFRDEFHRGDEFRAAVAALASEPTGGGLVR